MRSFGAVDPVKVALAGLTTMALGMAAALNADALPVIGGGTTYSAEFSDAGGLRADNDVRIAGVKVGKVSEIDLEGDRVLVSFRVKDAWVGDATSASIQIKNVLGQKYLALDPRGEAILDPGEPIPLRRTTAPYDVLEAFRDLSKTVDAIDVGQLAKSFDTISATFADTPADVRSALEGIAKLSGTIASRDRQLRTLVANTRQVSQTLVDRDTEAQRLIQDGNALLRAISTRQQAIKDLLDGSKRLATALDGIIADNDGQLGPVLEQLDRLTSMLQRNQDSLAKGIAAFAPAIRVLTNVAGNGRWIDGYLCGLVLPTFGPLNEKGCFEK
ncbi:MCE family protein [Amycolatopsis keratiniphila]|uniref:MCE family protein n=1 Tax=Amycolatopsis keratiniphila TaxID=129921 RepID=UPI000879F32C|nr:MCE family protein [Amycolatopsis keratiniphila]OLZ56315.1 ABC transporter substrate-binding protein [Amycolatopsis keratiniphila subsp. nogabecina]SDU53261.1 phospholipid/cholesterol/gamma-HCH transport system substrate-binding protein [Amycolatopsis keratiniphila]